MVSEPNTAHSPSVPHGFRLSRLEPDRLRITYRHFCERYPFFFFIVFIAFWTFECVFMTFAAIFHKGGVHYFMLAFMVPFWILDIYVIREALWASYSTTTFELDPERLVVERALFSYRRRHCFERSDIQEVRQVVEYDSDREPAGTGLVIVAGTRFNVFGNKPPEKTSWLGDILANWAGTTLIRQPTGKQFDTSL